MDRQALNRALRANRHARELLRRLLQRAGEHRGSGWLYPYLAELAQLHSETLAALHEMERIRNGGEDE